MVVGRDRYLISLLPSPSLPTAVASSGLSAGYSWSVGKGEVNPTTSPYHHSYIHQAVVVGMTVGIRME